MELSESEIVFHNYDLMIYIYKMLNFDDKLRLAHVNKTLKHIYEIYIWPVTYGSLKIYKSDLDYVVTNETETNRLLLSDNEYQEFVRYYALKVNELTLYHPIDVKPFKNISRLRCDLEASTEDDFQVPLMAATNLTLLEDLEMNGCVLQPKVKYIDEKLVKYVIKMKHLKRLCLTFFGNGHQYKMQYKNFATIVSNLKLEILKLGFLLEPQNNDNNSETANVSFTNPFQFKELEISLQHKNPSDFISFFKNCENLTILCLQVAEEVNQETLTLISSHGKNLRKLSIEQTKFVNIQSFCLPPNVSELCLEQCLGLTYLNLKQILTKTQLNAFISNGEGFNGVFEDFQISPSIETLSIANIKMSEFRSAYEENTNLKNLRWDQKGVHDNLTRLVAAVPLASCINLETLDMAFYSQLDLGIAMHLKHLRKLITHVAEPQKWTYITTLLGHPSLRELTIMFIEDDDAIRQFRHFRNYDSSIDTSILFKNVCDNEHVPTLGAISTNVTTLEVEGFHFGEPGLEFFLELLCRNTAMQISFWNYHLISPKLVLKHLVNHKKFPRDLQSLEIGGFILNCNFLRRSFDAAMQKFKYVYNRSSWDPRKYNPKITLCRNIRNWHLNTQRCPGYSFLS